MSRQRTCHCLASLVIVGLTLSQPYRAAGGQASPRSQEKPLRLDQVIQLISIMPDGALAGEIRDRGIDFTLSEQLVDKFRDSRAGQETVSVLRGFLANNHVPSLELSLDSMEIQRGGSVKLAASAHDRDGDALVYFWSTTSGSIEGGGSEVKLNTNTEGIAHTSETQQVTVNVTVRDRWGGAATASKTVQMRNMSPMSITKWPDGLDSRFAVVSLAGRQGGTIISREPVVVEFDGGKTPHVTGVLPGTPCQAAITSLENVAEYSFRDRPSMENGWGYVSVRIRPQIPGRLVRFSIDCPVAPSLGSKEDAPAVVTHRVEPRYPTAARRAGASGRVTVEVTIDQHGEVFMAKAISGHPMLQQAAVDAVTQWRFRPAMRSGKPVTEVQKIDFDFVSRR